MSEEPGAVTLPILFKSLGARQRRLKLAFCGAGTVGLKNCCSRTGGRNFPYSIQCARQCPLVTVSEPEDVETVDNEYGVRGGHFSEMSRSPLFNLAVGKECVTTK